MGSPNLSGGLFLFPKFQARVKTRKLTTSTRKEGPQNYRIVKTATPLRSSPGKGVLKPNLSDYQVPKPNPGGRKARPYKILFNHLGRGLDRRFIPARTERAVVSNDLLESLNLGKRFQLLEITINSGALFRECPTNQHKRR
jgi:hypothetical protein